MDDIWKYTVGSIIGFAILWLLLTTGRSIQGNCLGEFERGE